MDSTRDEERERLAKMADAEAGDWDDVAEHYHGDPGEDDLKQTATDWRTIASILRSSQDRADGDVPGQAAAWEAVCELLDELEVPRFEARTGREGVLLAIRNLHRRADVGDAEPVAKWNDAAHTVAIYAEQWIVGMDELDRLNKVPPQLMGAVRAYHKAASDPALEHPDSGPSEQPGRHTHAIGCPLRGFSYEVGSGEPIPACICSIHDTPQQGEGA